MKLGRVRDFQARMEVTFRLSQMPDITIEFVVDTGFEGALTLPTDAVAVLDLPLIQEMSANLADDSFVMTNVHAATILWGEELLNVAVLAMGRRPLLGTSLLGEQHLGIDFTENGQVVVRTLSD